jgi:surface protein
MILSEAKVVKLDKVYIYLIKLGNSDVIYYKLPLYVPGEFSGREELYKVATLVDESHTSLSDMFSDCLYLATINGITEWDTSNVTDMSRMFFCCTSLKSLDLSNFDTSNVTNMIGMFNGCNSLESIDLSSFNNTSNVTDMSWMFYSCDNLTTLDLSSFDTSNVTDMSWMFYSCDNLTELNLSNFDISNVTDMFCMFEYCNKLRTLRLDNCSKDTIRKIKTSEGFPTGKINGTTRKIYCKEENAAGLTAPDSWEFVYVG